jgi:hypothetical protein
VIGIGSLPLARAPRVTNLFVKICRTAGEGMTRAGTIARFPLAACASDPERQLCAAVWSPLGSRIHRCGGAATRTALRIDVHGIMFELVVEAHVVHPLEHLVLILRDVDGATASEAGRVCMHPRIMPVWVARVSRRASARERHLLDAVPELPVAKSGQPRSDLGPRSALHR